MWNSSIQSVPCHDNLIYTNSAWDWIKCSHQVLWHVMDIPWNIQLPHVYTACFVQLQKWTKLQNDAYVDVMGPQLAIYQDHAIPFSKWNDSCWKTMLNPSSTHHWRLGAVTHVLPIILYPNKSNTIY